MPTYGEQYPKRIADIVKQLRAAGATEEKIAKTIQALTNRQIPDQPVTKAAGWCSTRR